MREERGHFFLYVAPVLADGMDAGTPAQHQLRSSARLVHVGGGGEAVVAKFFDIGTEFGGIPNATDFGGMSVISVNGSFHPLRHRRIQIDPYFSAGYSGAFFADRKSGGLALGVGVNWWMPSALGLKVELRRSYAIDAREVAFGIPLRQ